MESGWTKQSLPTETGYSSAAYTEPILLFTRETLLQSLLGLSDSKSEAGLSVRGFREIGLLLETFRALSSIPLLDDVLALVVDTAIELTGAERGFIMLKDKNAELQFRCARNNFKRPLDGSSFQTSRRVPEDVFQNAKPLVINDLDVGAEDNDHATTRRLGVRSISCVPLRYFAFHDSGSLSGLRRMETLGVLYVDSQNVAARLSDTQLKALETLASEAAMAIYNARLYKESQEKRRLDEELAIAREIQQALLPPSHKIVPYACAYSDNIPCHEVGGDYLDYFDFDDGRLGFALGDVAGKGYVRGSAHVGAAGNFLNPDASGPCAPSDPFQRQPESGETQHRKSIRNSVLRNPRRRRLCSHTPTPATILQFYSDPTARSAS